MDTMPKITNLFLTLLNNMAILIVLAYVFSRTKLYEEILDKKITVKNKLFIIFIMGLFSIYGTLSGVDVLGAIANIRNLGPEIAGFIAGPIVGVLTGLVGGIHRLLLGGATAIPCCIATILAGLFSGIFYLINKKEFVGLKKAAIFAVLYELFHSGLVLLLGRPFEQMLIIEQRTTLPRMIVMGLGMAIFSFIIDNLTKERKIREDKQRIENELQVASQIQTSMLPRIFPPFPDRKEFDIFAVMHPAKEVGGDFFDFFLIDKDRLCFLIGDVSGKGIAAALFMVICKTLIKTEVLNGSEVNQVFQKVNNILVPDNEASMFVTLFCMILNIQTGEVEFANAGHNPPLIHKAGVGFEFLEIPKGFVIGPMPDTKYIKKSIKLDAGDMVFLYTDGVTEAINSKDEFFTEKRLKETLSNLTAHDAKGLINGVSSAIKTFVQNAPQSDDITILALCYRGG